MGVLFALILLSLAAAVPAEQVEELGISLNEVTKLVSVSSTLDPSKLILPEHEYEGTLGVSWTVPGESLRSLSKPRVVVYVRVAPAREDSWLWFQEGSARLGVLTFTLDCLVSNGACGEGSRLSRSFSVRFRAPANAQLPREERFRVIASLAPLGASREFLNLQTNVEEQFQRLRSLQDSVSRQALEGSERLVKQAHQLASRGEETLAIAALQEAKRTAEKAREAGAGGTPTVTAAQAQASAAPSPSPSVSASVTAKANDVPGALSGWLSRGEAPLQWGLLALLGVAAWATWKYWRRQKEWQLDEVAMEVETDNSLAGKAQTPKTESKPRPKADSEPKPWSSSPPRTWKSPFD